MCVAGQQGELAASVETTPSDPGLSDPGLGTTVHGTVRIESLPGDAVPDHAGIARALDLRRAAFLACFVRARVPATTAAFHVDVTA